MSWKRKRKNIGKNQNHSLSRKLRKENKNTEEFEIMLNNLSLEEAIGLKLELASRHFNSKMYGIPIWYSLKNIIQDAVLKYAYSSTKSKKEGARLLGITPAEFNKLLKKYDIENYFEEST